MIAGEAEGRDGAPEGDRRDQAEAVGLEEQAAKRGALEDRLDLGLGRRVGRRSLGQGHGRRTQLGVGLPATDLTEVHVDEVVGVDLRLLPVTSCCPAYCDTEGIIDLVISFPSG